METICGIDCKNCGFQGQCKGCCATNGKPFGGDCIAAEYIKVGGKEKYLEFKKSLMEEINTVLSGLGIPQTAGLYELNGSFVNLSYRLPSGASVQFLDDSKIYLGCQIEAEGLEKCFGVIADTAFLLVCSYGKGGTNPELILFKNR